MTAREYSYSRRARFASVYFSRFLTSRVLRLRLLGLDFRISWTWSLKAERIKPLRDLVPSTGADILKLAMAKAETEDAA